MEATTLDSKQNEHCRQLHWTKQCRQLHWKQNEHWRQLHWTKQCRQLHRKQNEHWDSESKTLDWYFDTHPIIFIVKYDVIQVKMMGRSKNTSLGFFAGYKDRKLRINIVINN